MWKNSRSRASTITNEYMRKISQLETALAQKDEIIASLSLANKKLRKERDELRGKNASQVTRLAEVSRKNSCAKINTPPRIQRDLSLASSPPTTTTNHTSFKRTSLSRLPSLPLEEPLHPSPKPHPLENGERRGGVTPPTLPPIKSNGIKEEDSSDTDYSDLDEIEEREEPKVNPSPPTHIKALKTDMGDDVAIEMEDSVNQAIKRELANVMTTTATSQSPFLVGYRQKKEGGSPVVGINRTHASNSTPLISPKDRKRQNSTASSGNSSTCSSLDGREGSYTLQHETVQGSTTTAATTSEGSKSSPPNRNSNSMMIPSSTRISSSTHLASTIRQIIERDSPGKERAKNRASKSNSVSFQDENGTEISSAIRNKAEDSIDGGMISRSAGAKKETVARTSSTGGGGGSGGKKGGEGEVAKRRAMFEKKSSSSASFGSVDWRRSDPITDSLSTVSSECTTTDFESSIEGFSPTSKQPSALSEDPTPAFSEDPTPAFSEDPTPAPLKSSHVSPLASLPDISIMGSRSVAMGTRTKVKDDFGLSINMDEEEDEDEISDMLAFKNNVRSRTNTLCSLGAGGRRRMEIGRKKIKEHRKEMKRASSIAAQGSLATGTEQFTIDRTKTKMELELISPLLAAKIKNMTLKRIYEQYGGKETVTKAVVVIENAYQTHKLRTRFMERLKETSKNRTMNRMRAQSLRPTRRPSIMNKKSAMKSRVSNESVAKSPKAADPMAKSKEASERLGKERLPHAHSGSRMELVERRRNEVQSKKSEGELEIVEEREEKADKEVKKVKTLNTSLSITQINFDMDASPSGGQQPVFVLSGVTDEEVSTDTSSQGTPLLLDKTDGLPASESSSFTSLARPVSIFSNSSVESSISLGTYLEDIAKSQTLPSGARLGQQAKNEMELQLMTGIHYFNRKPTKGIQYLIRKYLLDDDPKKVADFFVHQKGLSKEKIGEFLGEINSEFNMAVLECLVEHSHMGNAPIDVALREFQKLFRMPGEAQKIDKIMEVFALEYYKHNKALDVYRSEDGAYILSFAIMMLHTSLHNPSVKLRTSKKQWISMNRGTNDGESFSEPFLLDIYERIQSTEFATGQDHTHVVAEIEKHIIGSQLPRLSTPQRHLVCRFSVSEVHELNVRPGFRTKHRRDLFFFNDIVVVCKKKHHELLFKESFSLHNIVPVKFETPYYKCGVQLHPIDKDTPYQFNCDSATDRDNVFKNLESITQHLKIIEDERIAELGTTLTSNALSEHAQEGHRGRHNLTCEVGDLISSIKLTSPSTSLSTKHRGDFVSGVGDLAVASMTAGSKRINTENRISQDSGFVSTPTPPQSPSPYDTVDANIGSAHSTIPAHSPPLSSNNALTPSTPPPRSKSSDALRNTSVSPSPPSKSPSMDYLSRRRKSSPVTSADNSPLVELASSKGKKKERGTSEKKNRGLFNFTKSRSKEKESDGGGGGGGGGGKKKVKQTMSLSRDGSASPQFHRKLEQKLTASFDTSIDEPRTLTASLNV